MKLLDDLVSAIGSYWTHLSQPISFGSKQKAQALMNASPVSQGIFSLTPAQQATAVRIGVIATGGTIVLVGLSYAYSALARSYANRAQKQVFIPAQLRPNDGNKELIAGPTSLVSRVVSLFKNKVAYVGAGLTAVAGGIFLLAHQGHFAAHVAKVASSVAKK
jgi:hypothetical protein